MNGGGDFTIRATAFHAVQRGAVEVLEDALIEVQRGVIRRVVRQADPDHGRVKDAAAQAASLIELQPGQFLLPGLVDLHIHAPQWPQMGKALHRPLAEWLQRNTFPLEARYADAAFARRVYGHLVEALLANGTTTALYFATIHLEASRILAEICLERGQRALIGRVAMDDPDQCPDIYRDPSAEAALDGTRTFIETAMSLAGNAAALVRPVITPRFIPACTDSLLEGLGLLADEYGCHVQTHCAESDWEVDFVRRRLGGTDAGALASFGLMRRNTVLAHSNFLTPGDLDLIGSAGAGIAHCPLSNFYFANSVFPLRIALDRGVHVGLGSDVSGGHSPSIFDGCRHALAASHALEDGVDPGLPPGRRGRGVSRIDFREAFWLATAGGGEALDLPIGRFAAGYAFDAIVVDVGAPASNITIWDGLDSLEDILEKIVCGASRCNIAQTWVEGHLVHSLLPPP